MTGHGDAPRVVTVKECLAFPSPTPAVADSFSQTYCDDGLNGKVNCRPVHPDSDPVWEWIGRLHKLEKKIENCKSSSVETISQ